MKNALALLFVLLVPLALAANAPETAPSTAGVASCKTLYWLDGSHRECAQQRFCGMYMYYGLETFESEEDCFKAAGATGSAETGTGTVEPDKPVIPAEPVCGDGICGPGEANEPGGCGPNADPRCLGPPAREGSCPQDCAMPVCGDGICDAGEGEACPSCPPNGTDCIRAPCWPGSCPQDCAKCADAGAAIAQCRREGKGYSLGKTNACPSVTCTPAVECKKVAEGSCIIIACKDGFAYNSCASSLPSLPANASGQSQPGKSTDAKPVEAKPTPPQTPGASQPGIGVPPTVPGVARAEPGQATNVSQPEPVAIEAKGSWFSRVYHRVFG